MNTEATEYHSSLRGHAEKLNVDVVENNNGSDADAVVHHEKDTTSSALPVGEVDDTADGTNGINHHIVKTGMDGANVDGNSSGGGGGQSSASAAATNVTNNSTTSFLHDKKLPIIIPRNQSPHLTLPNYDEHQKLISKAATTDDDYDNEEVGYENLDENNAASLLHTKESQEQNAINLLENTPIRWDPPSDYFTNNDNNGNGDGGGGENDSSMEGSSTSSSSSSTSNNNNNNNYSDSTTSSSSSSSTSPRGPDEADGIESSSSSEGTNVNGYCKSQNGVFGSPRNGGVLLRYQYELTVDRRLGEEEWIDDILPNLEGGISDSLLPVLFEDECIPTSGGRKLRSRERALLLTSSLSDGEQEVVSSRGNLRGAAAVAGGERGVLARRLRRSSSSSSSRRRLEVIIGIDSEPRDFPARDKGKLNNMTT